MVDVTSFFQQLKLKWDRQGRIVVADYGGSGSGRGRGSRLSAFPPRTSCRLGRRFFHTVLALDRCMWQARARHTIAVRI